MLENEIPALVPMKLYIEVENGQPVNHPILELNLVHIYDSVENIPEKYEPFNRIPQNVSSTVLQRVVNTYEKTDGVWQDVWSVEDLVGEELLNAKQQLLEQSIATLPNILEKSKRILSQSINDTDKHTVSSAYIEILENLELTIDNPAIPSPPEFDETLGKWVLK